MTDPTKALRSAAEALQRRDFMSAHRIAAEALTASPLHPGLLGITALALLQMERRDEAVPYLKRQLGVTPQDQAVRFNLANVLANTGALDEARELALDHRGHPGLARLAGYFLQQDGQVEAAAAAYRTALAAAPQDWESWNNLGNCLVASGKQAEAVAAFENAINRSLGASLPEVFLNLSQALGAVENRDKRLINAEEAARRFPDHHGVRIELGLAQAAAGRRDLAEVTLRRAAANEDHFGEARLELGLLLENDNRLDELDAHIAECEALDGRPELAFLKAWSLRRRERFAEAEQEANRIPDTINPIRTAQVRAEVLDRLGKTDEAFQQFTAMNAASRIAHPPASGANYRETIEAQTLAMVGPLAPVPALANAPRDPVFIVGSPRSGTTLLDTLLTALPELQVFEEQPMLATVEQEFPGIPADPDPARVAAARLRYFALAEELQGAAGGRRIVDKMPLHLTHMPVIHRLFPHADVVLVERHPCDAVLSCFMANFSPNFAMQSYTDLEEAARTYAAVFANFERADELLPLRVHRVRYERMIADLEGEMRPLLNFLGVAWRDEVLDNQSSAQRRGAVRTASYAQIGQPLYQRAIGRWGRYRTHLSSVLPILDPWIERLGYES
ncbi:MAG TPA: sulfotransferase [Novosphingobium sp.]|nr:sulfotransferase [Novosphingobium sp.]HQA16804.1 sulfotransferase [Novosphingobium sp.]